MYSKNILHLLLKISEPFSKEKDLVLFFLSLSDALGLVVPHGTVERKEQLFWVL